MNPFQHTAASLWRLWLRGVARVATLFPFMEIINFRRRPVVALFIFLSLPRQVPLNVENIATDLG